MNQPPSLRDTWRFPNLKQQEAVALAATVVILPNEPAFLLSELVGKTPDSLAFHRYQIIKVVRDDRLVEWREDLGESSQFTADEFNILGGWVQPNGHGEAYHTVDELQGMARDLRNRDVLPDIIQDEIAREKEDWADLKKGRF